MKHTLGIGYFIEIFQPRQLRAINCPNIPFAAQYAYQRMIFIKLYMLLIIVVHNELIKREKSYVSFSFYCKTNFFKFLFYRLKVIF